MVMKSTVFWDITPDKYCCIQNYRVFGLLPLSGILGTRKHYVSGTGSVSVLGCGGGVD
jgi:hypothetical protein